MSGKRKVDDGLPSRLYEYKGKRRITYFTITKDNKRIYLGRDIERAKEALNDELGLSGESFAANKLSLDMCKRASKNAKSRNIPFEITPDDIQAMIKQSKGFCEVTGLKFSNAKIDGMRVRPYRPSIDRINSKLGYTKENTRVVCALTNLAMNQFGEGALLGMLSGMLKKRISENKPSYEICKKEGKL